MVSVHDPHHESLGLLIVTAAPRGPSGHLPTAPRSPAPARPAVERGRVARGARSRRASRGAAAAAPSSASWKCSAARLAKGRVPSADPGPSGMARGPRESTHPHPPRRRRFEASSRLRALRQALPARARRERHGGARDALRSPAPHLPRPAPPAPEGRGQVVIASGDVLPVFDPGSVSFAAPGIVGLGAAASARGSEPSWRLLRRGGRRRQGEPLPPETRSRASGEARRHGPLRPVPARHRGHALRRRNGDPVARGLRRGPWARTVFPRFEDAARDLILDEGIDFYREICCALGAESGPVEFIEAARGSGSTWPDARLERLHRDLSGIPFSVEVLHPCGFHHFGDHPSAHPLGPRGARAGPGPGAVAHLSQNGESRRILRPRLGHQRLGGRVPHPGRARSCGSQRGERAGRRPALRPALRGLPVRAPGKERGGETRNVSSSLSGWTISSRTGPRKERSIAIVPCTTGCTPRGSLPADLWDEDLPESERTLWNARFILALDGADAFRRFLWIFRPGTVHRGGPGGLSRDAAVRARRGPSPRGQRGLRGAAHRPSDPRAVERDAGALPHTGGVLRRGPGLRPRGGRARGPVPLGGADPRRSPMARRGGAGAARARPPSRLAGSCTPSPRPSKASTVKPARDCAMRSPDSRKSWSPPSPPGSPSRASSQGPTCP